MKQEISKVYGLREGVERAFAKDRKLTLLVVHPCVWTDLFHECRDMPGFIVAPPLGTECRFLFPVAGRYLVVAADESFAENELEFRPTD